MEAGGGVRNMTDAERTQAATALWNEEKGTAAAVIILGWLSKVRVIPNQWGAELKSQPDLFRFAHLLIRNPPAQGLVSYTSEIAPDSVTLRGCVDATRRRGRRRRLLPAPCARPATRARTWAYTQRVLYIELRRLRQRAGSLAAGPERPTQTLGAEPRAFTKRRRPGRGRRGALR